MNENLKELRGCGCGCGCSCCCGRGRGVEAVEVVEKWWGGGQNECVVEMLRVVVRPQAEIIVVRVLLSGEVIRGAFFFVCVQCACVCVCMC